MNKAQVVKDDDNNNDDAGAMTIVLRTFFTAS